MQQVRAESVKKAIISLPTVFHLLPCTAYYVLILCFHFIIVLISADLQKNFLNH